MKASYGYITNDRRGTRKFTYDYDGIFNPEGDCENDGSGKYYVCLSAQQLRLLSTALWDVCYYSRWSADGVSYGLDADRQDRVEFLRDSARDAILNAQCTSELSESIVREIISVVSGGDNELAEQFKEAIGGGGMSCCCCCCSSGDSSGGVSCDDLKELVDNGYTGNGDVPKNGEVPDGYSPHYQPEIKGLFCWLAGVLTDLLDLLFYLLTYRVVYTIVVSMPTALVGQGILHWVAGWLAPQVLALSAAGIASLATFGLDPTDLVTAPLVYTIVILGYSAMMTALTPVLIGEGLLYDDVVQFSTDFSNNKDTIRCSIASGLPASGVVDTVISAFVGQWAYQVLLAVLDETMWILEYDNEAGDVKDFIDTYAGDIVSYTCCAGTDGEVSTDGTEGGTVYTTPPTPTCLSFESTQNDGNVVFDVEYGESIVVDSYTDALGREQAYIFLSCPSCQNVKFTITASDDLNWYTTAGAIWDCGNTRTWAYNVSGGYPNLVGVQYVGHKVQVLKTAGHPFYLNILVEANDG